MEVALNQARTGKMVFTNMGVLTRRELKVMAVNKMLPMMDKKTRTNLEVS